MTIDGQLISELGAEGFRACLRIGGGLLVFVAAILLAGVLDALCRRIDQKTPSRRDDQLWNFLGQIVRITALTLGTITALGTMGVNVSALVAGLGLTGFAMGFALKDAISNLMAGILILLYRPFHLHEHIAVAGFEGRVTAIDLRYTTLADQDKRYLIPNSMLFTNTVTVITVALQPAARHEEAGLQEAGRSRSSSR